MSINLRFPLKKGTQGPFATNENSLDAVADDLRILLITNFGERPVQYDFGANLRGLIFEFQGEQLRQAVKDRILDAVSKWMPFVNIVDIQISDETTNSSVESNKIDVKIKFSIGNIDITKSLQQTIKV